MNDTSVSSISTDCSIQSILIKSDSPTFIDLFFSIDYSWYITSIMTKGLVVNGGVYESEIGAGSSTGYLI